MLETLTAAHALLLRLGGEEMGSELVLTLSIAIGVGAFLTVLAKRLRIPGIVLLVIGGVSLGPEGWNVVRPDSLGPALNVLVSMAVGLILFEGGLTLNVAGYRSAGKVIRRLLTLGVIVTWLGAALAIWFFYRFDPLFCILTASLVIVTGPTVIQPILKRIRLQWNLHHTLHWEGVLIDPIGVFAAVLVFDLVVGGAGEMAFYNLGLRILGGFGIGFLGGTLVLYLLRRKWIPDETLNGFMVGAAILIFGLTEAVIAEGGLLSVTVAGMVIGARKPPEMAEIVHFKSVIVDLLIGFIFILLTARLELVQFRDFGWKGLALVAVVMCVVRPATIFACTLGTDLSLREKGFLSWIAPRGVVAASMASLFALSLESQGRFADPAFLETFVYSVIFATVILQGFSADPLARILRLKQPEPQGWLIVGAHPLGRAVAHFLRDVRQVPVLLIDGNRRAVVEAEAEGLPALFADARETEELEDRDELQGIGRLLAFTDNEDLNELLCKKWEPHFGSADVYRWAATKSEGERATGAVLWSWMPKPSVISSEVMLEEAALKVLDGERKTAPGNLAALLTANSLEVLLDPRPDSTLNQRDGTTPQTLYLQREADFLLNALDPGLVTRSEAQDRETLFAELASILIQRFPGLSETTILRQILERENALPTTRGKGIAVPHATLPDLPACVCLVAQVPDGLRLFPSDPEPVKLVFLLLGPEDEPEMLLAILGELARLVADPAVRERLLACTEPDEIFKLVRRHRRQHTAFADVRK